MARRRSLNPEEQELWQAVARSARAMHGPKPAKAKKQVLDTLPITVSEPVIPTVEDFAQALAAIKPVALFGKAKAEKPMSKIPPRVGLDLAPSIRERLETAPLNMDAKLHGRMTRGKIMPEARIDLHGLTLAEAHPELIRFILNAQSQGLRLVLVITGKGKEKEENWPMPSRIGALRHQVPQWLRMAPLGPAVLQVTQAHLRHGGHGAYYVYLRRR